jgi:chorismate-pyruvate lyase
VSSEPSRQLAEAELYAGSASRLASLFFRRLEEIGRFEPVAVDDLPVECRRLLAHNGHMTVALESYHNSLVDVHAVAEWRDESSYARCSLLSRQSDDAIVQFGIMRIWLADLPNSAQREITEQKLPLGRVLINHNLLREVEVISLWRITPGQALRQHLQLRDHTPIYGRSAQILVDERPTVQVLEIVKLPN